MRKTHRMNPLWKILPLIHSSKPVILTGEICSTILPGSLGVIEIRWFPTGESRASQSTKVSRFPCWWFVFPKYVSNKCPIIMVEVETCSPPNVHSNSSWRDTFSTEPSFLEGRVFNSCYTSTGFLPTISSMKSFGPCFGTVVSSDSPSFSAALDEIAPSPARSKRRCLDPNHL